MLFGQRRVPEAGNAGTMLPLPLTGIELPITTRDIRSCSAELHAGAHTIASPDTPATFGIGADDIWGDGGNVAIHHRAVPVDDSDPEADLFEQPIRPLAQRPVRDDPVIGNLGEISMRLSFSTFRGAVVPAGRYPALTEAWTPGSRAHNASFSRVNVRFKPKA